MEGQTYILFNKVECIYLENLNLVKMNQHLSLSFNSIFGKSDFLIKFLPILIKLETFNSKTLKFDL
jgi:hypothetical protein